ncbi:nucleotidyl transferase AbiEii/AbiGii toxin family protein [Treponema primitia]|uniref:nucleotidyl transferase AbiEii/AbiGii toxin family protein n=1 Tax=Treponema primitia TaxID=88058 RepID=UPI00398185F5
MFLDEIKKYDITTANDQELAAGELLQKIILAGLSETDFFENASFHGGTALRIFYGLNRYSQDLDFSLIKKQGKFEWKKYLVQVQDRMKEYGCSLELYDKSIRDSPVVIAEIRDLSIGRMLDFEWATRIEHPKKIMVKLEMDSNPPDGGVSEEADIRFPYSSKIRLNDMPTLFSGKAHALLCRDYGDYVKGRDWYDFLWYMGKKIEPNYQYLSDAINRNGPWQGKNIKVTKDWFEKALQEKIISLNMEMVKRDVIRFVNPVERDMVNTWTRDIFLNALETFYRQEKHDKKIFKHTDLGRI